MTAANIDIDPVGCIRWGDQRLRSSIRTAAFFVLIAKSLTGKEVE
jgi:hypothetical protein